MTSIADDEEDPMIEEEFDETDELDEDDSEDESH